MLAEHAIAKLVMQYALHNDAREFGALAEMFVEQGKFTRPAGGDPIVGRQNIRESYEARPARVSRHLVANIVVDLLSDTDARCRSTMMIFASPAGELPVHAASPAQIGGYDDVLRRENGTWLFVERRGHLDIEVNLAAA